MTDSERQIDYSMPRQCGLYPPPPYRYPGMRALIVLFQAELSAKQKVLPPELEPIEYGFDAIFISEYPDSTVGPYNENLILLYCNYKGEPGLWLI
ncbi:MAG: acetoacetate decarboxylase family protein [Promethearchaeia archaeon]